VDNLAPTPVRISRELFTRVPGIQRPVQVQTVSPSPPPEESKAPVPPTPKKSWHEHILDEE
jgi:hypothetical protein